MKYSAVLVAAFAATAMARAVPDGEGFNPVKAEKDAITSGKAEEYDDKKKYEDKEYEDKKYDDGKKYDDKKYDDGKKDEKKYDDKKYDAGKKDEKKDKYPSTYYESPEYKDYEKKETEYYKPEPKKRYDDNYEDKEHKYYAPKPEKYDVEKSCYDKLEWAVNVHKEKPCHIKWQPKHGGDWKKEDDTVVYLYHCKDYSKPKEKVCDECGKGDYKDWKPSNECEASDSEGGSMYRFKFCKKGKEDEYTWGEEFPIYGDKYDDKKEEVCPPPKPVPECPEGAPAPPPPPPVKEAAPAEPCTDCEAPAPAAPVEAAPAPAPEAPVADVAPAAASNETEQTLAPVYPGASSAIRASVSLIVGVAALVTFAL